MKKEVFVKLFNETKEFYHKLEAAYDMLNIPFDNDLIISYIDSVLEAMIADLEQIPDEINVTPLILHFMFEMGSGEIENSVTVLVDGKKEVAIINTPEDLYDLIKRGAIKYNDN